MSLDIAQVPEASCARGEYLYHEERLFLASYMNAAGWDAEGAIEPLFEHMPDYDAQASRPHRPEGLQAGRLSQAQGHRHVPAGLRPQEPRGWMIPPV